MSNPVPGVGSCNTFICGALYDAAETVGEMDTLLELAKRVAVKAQNWEKAAELRDTQHRLKGRRREEMLREVIEPEKPNELPKPQTE